ncbi:hypothetical protein J3F83DRAFT_243700 [Trichoderma novae-zelandiae]
MMAGIPWLAWVTWLSQHLCMYLGLYHPPYDASPRKRESSRLASSTRNPVSATLYCSLPSIAALCSPALFDSKFGGINGPWILFPCTVLWALLYAA